MGIVEKAGPAVTKLKVGERVVASFQIAWYVMAIHGYHDVSLTTSDWKVESANTARRSSHHSVTTLITHRFRMLCTALATLVSLGTHISLEGSLAVRYGHQHACLLAVHIY